MEGKTTITVDNEVWQELNVRRLPGDRFNDVIERLLEDVDELQERVDELEEQLQDE
jgi:predicted CopG family antitoxin